MTEPAVRASDAERERARSASRTRGELETLLADLPAPAAHPRGPRRWPIWPILGWGVFVRGRPG